jgi:hypothetical protein
MLEYPWKIEVPIPDKEEASPSNLRREYQQREVTMPQEDKNQNGKRHIEMKLTGKKDRNLRKELRSTSYKRFQKEPRRRKICKIRTSSG